MVELSFTNPGRRVRVHHIVWDWNSTLLDDNWASVRAAGEALAGYGLRPVDERAFRDHYTRPWRTFFDGLAGRRLTDDEWPLVESAYHRHYAASLGRVALARDAVAALRRAAEAGTTQSVLSMWRHDALVELVARHSLTPYLTRVEGRTTPGGGPKSAFLTAHLSTLGAAPRTALLIGDTLDDLAAAQAAGTDCVLYDGGTHHLAALTATRTPVARSLLEALELGGVLPAGFSERRIGAD